MNILLVIAAIGGFIKIIETTIVVINWVDRIISNIIVHRRMMKNLKEWKKGVE